MLNYVCGDSEHEKIMTNNDFFEIAHKEKLKEFQKQKLFHKWIPLLFWFINILTLRKDR